MTVSPEILSLINSFSNKIIDILSNAKDEVLYYFNKGIPEYVGSIEDKFLHTKTFMYRTETVNFYDVYFEISLKNKQCDNYVVKNIEDLFKSTNFISIIGNAGSGKSMLLKHIFLQSIKQTLKIPIVIELRNLNDYSGNFLEYLNSLLCSKQKIPNTKILERILSEGNFLFLFDGYDEIYSKNKEKLTSELINFIDNFNRNYFLITSRHGAGLETIPRFDSYHINKLNNTQIEQFTRLQLQHNDDLKLADKIISVINKYDNKTYREYLSSPLLLSMFIVTFNSYPELPTSRSKFYWNIFDTLCNKHDSFTKHGGFQHERKSKLKNEDIETILKWFAYRSFFSGKYGFDRHYFKETLQIIKDKLSINCDVEELIYDLVVSIAIIMEEGLEYKFPHRSLQEYFAAMSIKEKSDADKQTIYSKGLSRLFLIGNDNFLKLCCELDKKAFNKYFILHNLENFISKINTTSEETTCKSLLGMIEFSQMFDKKTYTMNHSRHTGSIFMIVTDFLNLGNLSWLLHSAVNKASSNIQENNLIDLLTNIGIHSEKFIEVDYTKWSEQIYQFVTLLGMKDIILNTIKEITIKISELKQQILTQEDNENDLLNL